LPSEAPSSYSEPTAETQQGFFRAKLTFKVVHLTQGGIDMITILYTDVSVTRVVYFKKAV